MQEVTNWWLLKQGKVNPPSFHCCNTRVPPSALLSSNDKEKLLKEVSLMVEFKHPNVMSLTGVCIDGEMPLLIMPFMTNGTVLQYVKKERYKLYIKEADNEIEVGNTLCVYV